MKLLLTLLPAALMLVLVLPACGAKTPEPSYSPASGTATSGVAEAPGPGGPSGPGKPISTANQPGPGGPEGQKAEDGGMQMPFALTVAKAGGYDSKQELPLARTITTPEELEAFYDEFKEPFALDKASGDDGFSKVMERYDEDFFKSQLVLVALLEASGGAESFTLDSVAVVDEEKYVLSATSATEGIGTTALEYIAWFVEIGTQSGNLPAEVKIS